MGEFIGGLGTKVGVMLLSRTFDQMNVYLNGLRMRYFPIFNVFPDFADRGYLIYLQRCLILSFYSI